MTVMVILIRIAFPGTGQAQPLAAGDPFVLASHPDEHFMNAGWSADGRLLAFTTDHFNGLWLCDADGENLRKLTADPAVGFGYSWSPSGKLILGRSATYQNRRRFHQVKVYDALSAQEENLLDKSRELKGLPVWTTDGSRVAMMVGPELKTGMPEKFEAVPKSGLPQKAIYAVNGKLFAADPETRSQTLIADFGQRNIFNISVSPRGDKVAFQVRGKGLYAVGTNGDGLLHLGQGEQPAWMPGGDFLVVALVEDDGYAVTSGELYAVDTATAASYHLGPLKGLIALRPAISPCGGWVAFDNPRNGKIYLMPIE